ncbi:MAG: PIG-L family deacetylase [Thermodesulfobacteriota bacterium]|jgi:LmbE family N-acetylglucosaminyl deacetylase|nr:MAG: PIG-L family deacetylase [Thermodesulfobacteriota bacterium]
MTTLHRPAHKVLFVGAHPDDIEIGAGGTVARLIDSGWDVWFCILTTEDDPKKAQKRKIEAVQSAQVLGVDPSQIIFLDFPDKNLQCNGHSIEKFRMALKERAFDPDIVFTHGYESENHNDHRAAHAITRGTFRKKILLIYPVVNSLVASSFLPKLFIDISSGYKRKLMALEKHESQSQHGRIRIEELTKLAKRCSSGLDIAEAFEILIQEGSDDQIGLLYGLNDCPFHKFWHSLIDTRILNIIHGLSVQREKRLWYWPGDKDREGVTLLSRAFQSMWYGPTPIDDYAPGTAFLESSLLKNDILLSGGAVSNLITRTYFNHFKGMRYIIGYSMPDYTDIHIRDLSSSKKIYAQYEDLPRHNRTVTKDVGILTVMKNPLDETKQLIGCMGIHGFGTLACHKVLSSRILLKELMELIDVPLIYKGYQILIDYNVRNEKVTFRKKNLHKM